MFVTKGFISDRLWKINTLRDSHGLREGICIDLLSKTCESSCSFHVRQFVGELYSLTATELSDRRASKRSSVRQPWDTQSCLSCYRTLPSTCSIVRASH
eukprot:4068319-Amphidinium_carterae.1